MSATVGTHDERVEGCALRVPSENLINVGAVREYQAHVVLNPSCMYRGLDGSIWKTDSSPS